MFAGRECSYSSLHPGVGDLRGLFTGDDAALGTAARRADITHEELEHLIPSLPVEAIGKSAQRRLCGCVPAQLRHQGHCANGRTRGLRPGQDNVTIWKYSSCYIHRPAVSTGR
jgi:hypothetical protein